MRLEEVKSILRREPFVPMRVFKADGTAVDILYPHVALISDQGLIVFKGVKGPKSRQAEGFEVIVYERIERIEPMAELGLRAG